MKRRTLKRDPLIAAATAYLATTFFAAAGAVAQTDAAVEETGAAARGVAPTPVEATSLYNDAFATGVLTQADGALPQDLWGDADPDALTVLLKAAPARPASPAVGEAMRRVLLSPGAAPDGAGPSLGGRKLMALSAAGFVEEARTIASLSNASAADPWVGRSLAIADVLSGDIAAACARGARLTSGAAAPFWVKLRVLCYAEAEEYDAADLTLGILREQGALTELDDRLLTAVSIPSPIKGAVAPDTALHLAVMRKLGAAASPSTVRRAGGGVLTALARVDDPASRLAAVQALAAMGVADAETVRAAYRGVAFEDVSAAAMESRLGDGTGDVMSDALAFQAVEAMSSPELVRDRAALVARAIAAPQSFTRAYAAAVAYAEIVDGLDGVIVAPNDAGWLALSEMAVGDARGARRWLEVMLGRGLSGRDDAAQLRFIELTNWLAALDPMEGAAVSAAANVALELPPAPSTAGDAALDRELYAQILTAAFDAVVDGAAGQAGLAAIALSADAYADEPAARSIAERSFDAAGLEGLARRLRFEAAWRASLPVEADAGAAGDADRGFAPRLKPSRR